MEFIKDGKTYTVIDNGRTSNRSHLYLYTVWNKYGQRIDIGEVEANTFKEAKDRILDK